MCSRRILGGLLTREPIFLAKDSVCCKCILGELFTRNPSYSQCMSVSSTSCLL